MADARHLLLAAKEALERSDRAAFVTAARAMVSAGSAIGPNWRALAYALMDFGEVSLALSAMDNFARRTPAAQVDRAALYARAGKLTTARRIIESVDRSIPDRASNAYLRGTIALNDGAIDEARNALLEAAGAMPYSGQIWQTLASTGPMSDEPAIADAIRAAGPALRDAPDIERAAYNYALGKVFNDEGEYDLAYASFSAGADILARLRPYSYDDDARSAERSIAEWDRSTVLSLATHRGRDDSRPIFVTGMPRSGSTLVEQILASHSAVVGGEELRLFSIIVREIGGSDLSTVRRWLERRSMEEATALYAHLITERFGTAGRIIDKTLQTSRYLGLIASAFPSAPIVWMRRDPLNCAWSCFRTYFAQGLGWSYCQAAIAQHLRLEDKMLDHWQNILKDQMLVVDYELLVQDHKPQIDRLIQHCGLTVEPQIYVPEKTRRAVVTASAVQVREPINTRGLDPARAYRKHLQPFIDAYGYTG